MHRAHTAYHRVGVKTRIVQYYAHLGFVYKDGNIALEAVGFESLCEETDLFRSDLVVDIVNDPRPKGRHVEFVHLQESVTLFGSMMGTYRMPVAILRVPNRTLNHSAYQLAWCLLLGIYTRNSLSSDTMHQLIA